MPAPVRSPLPWLTPTTTHYQLHPQLVAPDPASLPIHPPPPGHATHSPDHLFGQPSNLQPGLPPTSSSTSATSPPTPFTSLAIAAHSPPAIPLTASTMPSPTEPHPSRHEVPDPNVAPSVNLPWTTATFPVSDTFNPPTPSPPADLHSILSAPTAPPRTNRPRQSKVPPHTSSAPRHTAVKAAPKVRPDRTSDKPRRTQPPSNPPPTIAIPDADPVPNPPAPSNQAELAAIANTTQQLQDSLRVLQAQQAQQQQLMYGAFTALNQRRLEDQLLAPSHPPATAPTPTPTTNPPPPNPSTSTPPTATGTADTNPPPAAAPRSPVPRIPKSKSPRPRKSSRPRKKSPSRSRRRHHTTHHSPTLSHRRPRSPLLRHRSTTTNPNTIQTQITSTTPISTTTSTSHQSPLSSKYGISSTRSSPPIQDTSSPFSCIRRCPHTCSSHIPSRWHSWSRWWWHLGRLEQCEQSTSTCPTGSTTFSSGSSTWHASSRSSTWCHYIENTYWGQRELRDGWHTSVIGGLRTERFRTPGDASGCGRSNTCQMRHWARCLPCCSSPPWNRRWGQGEVQPLCGRDASEIGPALYNVEWRTGVDSSKWRDGQKHCSRQAKPPWHHLRTRDSRILLSMRTCWPSLFPRASRSNRSTEMTTRPPIWSTTEQAGIRCQRSWWKTASDQPAGQPTNKGIRPNTHATDSSECQLKSVTIAIWMPMLWSNAHPNYTKLGKDKRHLAYWPFVAHQKAPAIKRVGTTKSNAFANSMAYRGAKTEQRRWTPMPQQWLLSQAHTTFLNNSLHAPHRQQFLLKPLHPMTLQLPPPRIHPHPLQTQHYMNQPVQTPATRTTRQPIVNLVLTIIVKPVLKIITDPPPGTIQRGTITPGGMNPIMAIVAILPLRKDVHAVDIVKGAPELTAITIPPHVLDGDLYDIGGVYWNRGFPLFGVTMLLPTLGYTAISSKKEHRAIRRCLSICRLSFVMAGAKPNPISHCYTWALYGWG